MSKKQQVTPQPSELAGIRPRSFDEIIGRETEKKLIRLAIMSSHKRKEQLDHMLFYGPPGLGKTTFANAVASELGVSIKITSGPAIARQGDLASILTNLKEGSVLFIDEIHRLNKAVEEVLYPAMEDYCLDIVIGKGPGAKAMRLSLPKFTLVGATTRVSLLSTPLRDRFGLTVRIDYFEVDDLQKIIKRAARIMAVDISDEAAKEIAKRSRGTGRIALKLLKRVRDSVDFVKKDNIIDVDTARKALDFMGIDGLGLNDIDRRYLSLLVEKFEGGPVGLSTLAVALSEDKDTISEVIEPYLVKMGLIQRTRHGRVASKACYEHLGVQITHKLL